MHSDSDGATIEAKLALEQVRLYYEYTTKVSALDGVWSAASAWALADPRQACAQQRLQLTRMPD